jgi:hypothetical protein
MRAYGKVIMAVIGAAVTALYGFLDDGHLSTDEWIKIAIATVLAINVYVVPVTAEWPWMKTAIGAVLAALQVLVVVIVGGVNSQEVIEIIIAVLTAIGVAVTPAISHNGQPASP